jgi:hypothetical protein
VPVVRRQCHFHPTAGFGELERVRDQVVENLGQARPVANERRRVSDRGDELDLSALRHRAARLDRFLHDLREIHLLEVDLEGARIDLGEEQQVSDQFE